MVCLGDGSSGVAFVAGNDEEERYDATSSLEAEPGGGGKVGAVLLPGGGGKDGAASVTCARLSDERDAGSCALDSAADSMGIGAVEMVLLVWKTGFCGICGGASPSRVVSAVDWADGSVEEVARWGRVCVASLGLVVGGVSLAAGSPVWEAISSCW